MKTLERLIAALGTIYVNIIAWFTDNVDLFVQIFAIVVSVVSIYYFVQHTLLIKAKRKSEKKQQQKLKNESDKSWFEREVARHKWMNIRE